MDPTNKTSPGELLAIGEILKPRGVRGELKLRLLCNDFEDFLDCMESGELFLWWASGNAPIFAPEHAKNLLSVLNSGKDTVSGASLSDKKEPSPRGRLSRSQLLAGAPYLFEGESVRFHAGFVLLQLAGIESLEDAEQLRGAMVGLRAADIPQPEGDTFYQFQLEGLRVVVEGTGDPVGIVDSVQENPAHDLLLIRPEDPQLKPFLLPLVEAFVKRVDLEEGKIEVDLPEGLIESV